MGTLTFIIILGIISSIFGKVKANLPKTQNKPFSVKNLDNFREAFSKSLESPVAKEDESTLEKIQEKYQRVKQETVEIQPIAQVEEVLNVIKPKEKTVQSSETSEADKIINGIIWSEIIGQPRAKRSFLSSKRHW